MVIFPLKYACIPYLPHIFLKLSDSQLVYSTTTCPTSLNRNVGKYRLSHLWDRVLFNTPGLKIDSTKHPLHIHNKGLTQTIPTNNSSPMATGISGHALNSEHALRDA